MKTMKFVVPVLAGFVALIIGQSECAGGPLDPLPISVVDATVHRGYELNFAHFDFGDLVVRIVDASGTIDVTDNFCFFVNATWQATTAEETKVEPGDTIEWWVWESPATPVALVAEFVVE